MTSPRGKWPLPGLRLADGENARSGRGAIRAMSAAQRITGLTAAQLDEEQARLRAEAAGRRGGVPVLDEHVGGRDEGAIGIDRVEWVHGAELERAAVAAFRHLDRAEFAQAIEVLGTALREAGLLDEPAPPPPGGGAAGLFALGLNHMRALQPASQSGYREPETEEEPRA